MLLQLEIKLEETVHFTKKIEGELKSFQFVDTFKSRAAY